MLPTFAICYRAVGTVAIFCYRCTTHCTVLTTYASYLSCIIVQVQLTLLVRFITTYSDNAISLTLKNCYHKNSFATSSQTQ